MRKIHTLLLILLLPVMLPACGPKMNMMSRDYKIGDYSVINMQVIPGIDLEDKGEEFLLHGKITEAEDFGQRVYPLVVSGLQQHKTGRPVKLIIRVENIRTTMNALKAAFITDATSVYTGVYLHDYYTNELIGKSIVFVEGDKILFWGGAIYRAINPENSEVLRQNLAEAYSRKLIERLYPSDV